MKNKKSIPPSLIRTAYRKELWKNAQQIMQRIEKVIPISSAHLLGSFTTAKKRPADVDFILLLKTGEKNPKAHWSVDLVIAPDNASGEATLEDAKQWMKQKYGAKKSAVLRLK
ncbi:hypothetical protein HZA44_04570 [Candidatus Peregrinibacteria bacterium]|nr:hypothetical protein [Candidatus Peregrinibacteria bacterium]